MNSEESKYNNLHYKNEPIDTMDDMAYLYQITGKTEIDPDIDAAWLKMEKALGRNKTIQLFPFIKIAASVTLLLVSIFAFYKYNSPNEVLLLADQKETAILPDGSQVTLQENSSITYSENFTNERKVELSGQAYFNVKKGTVPFHVISGSLEVIVLGTKFVVSEEQVFLEEGSVKLKSNTHEILLKPGQTALYDSVYDKLNITTFNSNEISWATNAFEFKSDPLNKVIPTLEEHFGVRILLKKGRFGECEVTGSFRNNSLNEILNSITAVLNLKYTQSKDGKEYILKGEGCK